MRTFTLLLSALLISAAAMAQTVATFDTLHLSKPDTFYVNYSDPGADVGFNDGLAHFPCVYDTSWGGLWSSGFAYSNMTDSTTSGFTNQYSAKAGIGQAGSPTYVVANSFTPVKVQLRGAAVGKKVAGFFVTNSTYAYNSMRDGDFAAKKFGGATGMDPDWFKLTVKGYASGALTTDSVDFYLADFRAAGTASDYIVKDWRWVDLMSLGNVDSLQFSLSSSDTGTWGMNTPGYFCIDSFTTHEVEINAVHPVKAPAARIYPNPATEHLLIDLFDNSVKQATIVDAAGKLIKNVDCMMHNEISISELPAGVYLLQLIGSNGIATTRFEKR